MEDIGKLAEKIELSNFTPSILVSADAMNEDLTQANVLLSRITDQGLEKYEVDAKILDIEHGSILDSRGNRVNISEMTRMYRYSDKTVTYLPNGEVTVQESNGAYYGSIPDADGKSSTGFRKTPGGQYSFVV